MSRFKLETGAPTMLIPEGTQVEADRQGQLSIRTPGNLVLQSSGRYGTLESLSGSIRIEAGAAIEAVQVRCPGGCFVQGSLTAWRLSAAELHLADTAEAHIVLQEAGRVDVGKGARVIGNFGTERELFHLFSRFASQVRSLPFFLGGGEEDKPPPPKSLEAAPEDGENSEEEDASADGLPEPLLFAQILLERASQGGTHHKQTRERLIQMLELLENGDLDTLRMTYRRLLALREAPGPDIRRAFELVDRYFQGAAFGATATGG